MGVLAVDSIRSQTEMTEEAIVDSHLIKDKKKKRRSRRSKQIANSGFPGNLVNEMQSEESKLSGCGSTSVSMGLHLNGLAASDLAFSSLPAMHLTHQISENRIVQLQETFPPDVCDRAFSNSCPDPSVSHDAILSCVTGEFQLFPTSKSHLQRKIFAPYWSDEALLRGLENGDVLKALFRVNAHNRLEAYCKVDGVQTDILISGAAAQNRAVEGDIVAIKVDPPVLWTKMKGLTTEASGSSTPASTCNMDNGAAQLVQENLKGKGIIEKHCEYVDPTNYYMPQGEEFTSRDGYSPFDLAHPQSVGPTSKSYTTGNNGLSSDLCVADCSSSKNRVETSVQKLSSIVNSLPSKRPTGKVVAILEGSPRRDTIVGFLSVKKWMYGREIMRRDMKQNILYASNFEYILFTPADSRFSKMMVPVRGLPDCIKKRLEVGDTTVEMDLVGARIVDWSEENFIPEAQVLQVFGRGGEIEPQIAAILFENSINMSDFSPEVLDCIPDDTWEIPLKEFERRKDLRSLCVFTIDPDTATDLDDALSIERLPCGNFRVGVHIADVSYFVQPDSAVDVDAQIRSTSVYLLKQKLPILPHLLSENLGSLNPGVDRLAFSMSWDINPAGQVLDRWIGRTVIRSCCKLSYDHAQRIIDGSSDAGSPDQIDTSWPKLHGQFKWIDVIESIKRLHEVSVILKKNRFNDGALSLESPKLLILFDEDGLPYDSMLSGRIDSNFLVEEFMLLANRTAAEIISRAYPGSSLLRRHPEPNLRKLREFEAFCIKHGLKLDTTSSGQLHQSLERIRHELKDDSVMFDILMSYASKPMQLAAYFCSGEMEDENDWGHYALAVPLYTHFTSPLRRYPDIVVHRTLAAAVEAEEMYLKNKRLLSNLNDGKIMSTGCFTGVNFDKDSVLTCEAQEALSAAASRHGVLCCEALADVAAYCNERKLASRHAKDAVEKLYMWALLRRKEVIFAEARVMALGPRFMSVYVYKLSIERRIYYDEVEGLAVDWLESTSTLVLNLSANKRYNRRNSPGKYKRLEEVALVISPSDWKKDSWGPDSRENIGIQVSEGLSFGLPESFSVEPAFFPLTTRVLSTIPVALRAVGGDGGPLDIGARLFISSYIW